MAEAEIGQKINLENLYQRLVEKGFEPKFSEDLSVLIVDLKEAELMVFASGKISVKKANDEKTILESIKEFSGFL